MIKKPNSRKSKAALGATQEFAQGVPTGDAEVVVKTALEALIASENEWRVRSVADVVADHMPSIKVLLARGCPLEMIAKAVMKSGVSGQLSTYVKAISLAKRASAKAPKASVAASKTAVPRKTKSCVADDETMAGKVGFVAPQTEGEGPSSEEVREATDTDESITDVNAFLGDAISTT